LLNNLKILKISLNIRGKKTPTSQPKGANFFTKINHKFCKRNAKHFFQTSSPRTALKLSRPSGHG